MPSQSKLIKQGIYLTDNVFDEIIQRVKKGVKSSDTLEHFLSKYKEYTNGNGENNPLVINGYKEKMLDIILKETNNHKFSRPSQKELVRVTIENRVGDLIVDVGDDIKTSVRDIIKEGYNKNLSQDEIAENITHRVGVIKNTRARVIARTEIARTATASDYVINKERGATHFTVDCRDTCCGICARDYNWGKIEYTIDQVEMLPPRHPNCRCYAMFFIKEGFENQNHLDFKEDASLSSEGALKNIFAPLQNEPDYSESIEKFSMISEKKFKNDITGFVESKDKDIIANLVYIFRKNLPNINVEYGATFLYDSKIGFSSFNPSEVTIPDWIKKEGVENELLVFIHNHGKDLSNFPSYDDLESYALYGVKYGITTNNFGTIIVKNTEQQLNKENAAKIKNQIFNIKIGMIAEFEMKFNKKFDKNNLEHNKEISKMVDENRDKYLKQYKDVLNKYGMDITFINEQI